MSKQTSDAEPNISDFLAEYIDNVREGLSSDGLKLNLMSARSTPMSA